MTREVFIPLGRLQEYLDRLPADIAIRTGYRARSGIFGEYQILTYSNRPALLEAIRMANTGELGNLPIKPALK